MKEHGLTNDDSAVPATAPAPMTGRAYWRSLEHLANSPEFLAQAEREFPELAMELTGVYSQDGPSRRRFLQLMAASIALAGLTGCRRREANIRPYKQKPEEIILGKPLYYATTMVLAGVPIGLLVETHEGRPTKIEGNPAHPNSLGSTDVFAQASILDLYDPDRSTAPLKDGKPAGMKEDVLPALEKLAADLKANGGAGLAILTGDHASPAMSMLAGHIQKTLPKAAFFVHETAGASGSRAIYDLSKAEVILTLDCDLLGLEDEGIRHKRAFGEGRNVHKPGDPCNRLYSVEPHFTVTGMAADHRLRLPASQVEAIAQVLLAKVEGNDVPTIHNLDLRWIQAVADDLKAHAGKCVVAAGRRQPPQVHALAQQINQALGNVGKTIWYSTAPAPQTDQLVRRIGSGEVRTLLILNANPVYDAPADMKLAEAMAKVPTRIHLGLHVDETALACNWHIPAAHYLESWGDALSANSTYSPIQPMIEPLLGGITPLEMLARISGYETIDPQEIVKRSFAELCGGFDEGRWRQFLHTGAVEVKRVVQQALLELRDVQSPAAPSATNLELCFALSPTVFDGRFVNNGWMQECPDPVTKLTWDNAAMLSPATAKHFDLKTEDVVKITLEGRSIEAPVFIVPGHADWSVTLPLGYGRTAAGSIGSGVGFNANALRTSKAMGFALGATIEKTGKTYPLATTQDHWVFADRHVVDEQAKERAIVREGTIDEFEHNPHFAQEMGEHTPTTENIQTTPNFAGPHQWGMAIDLGACVGCNACVVACQAENNVPIVGKNEVIRGREMHWLRMDRYFTGEPEGDVRIAAEPMLCQHCENAPCEPVCPVNATVHSPEGLNEMVYNRCVGTRYCSNNCPYKVRRFNFFDYNKGTLREQPEATRDGHIEPRPTRGLSLPQILQPDMQELIKMQKNPNVTVRIRGVMEKCTYCVQRIQAAKIDTKAQAGQTAPSKVADGAVQTACQQACPTRAIVFGDISDPNSRVSQLRRDSRNYAVLGHINTRPRTTYLARLRNPNPALEPAGGKAPEGGHA